MEDSHGRTFSGDSILRVGFDSTPVRVSPAGEGRYTRELALALTNCDDVVLERFEASDRTASGTLSRVALGLSRTGWYYPFALSRRARARRVHVLHLPAPYSGFVGFRPLVVTVHDALALEHPHLFPRRIAFQARFLHGDAARSATRVLASCDYTRERIVELLALPQERVVTTRFGVNSRFRPLPADPAWLEQRFAIEGRFVLCVGTLEPRKNLVAAMRAFELVSHHFQDVALVIAGGPGWKNQEFEAALSRTSAAVRPLGFVSDGELVRLYSAAACFLFPSLYEGFGFPVLEAMACGTPVVSSDRGSLREIVGDAGLLVDPTDVEALADAIRRILESSQLAAELRLRGLERRRAYTWGACAAQTLEAYREALADGA